MKKMVLLILLPVCIAINAKADDAATGAAPSKESLLQAAKNFDLSSNSGADKGVSGLGLALVEALTTFGGVAGGFAGGWELGKAAVALAKNGHKDYCSLLVVAGSVAALLTKEKTVAPTLNQYLGENFSDYTEKAVLTGAGLQLATAAFASLKNLVNE